MILKGTILTSQRCGLCCPLLVPTYIHTISPPRILVEGGYSDHVGVTSLAAVLSEDRDRQDLLL